MVKDSIIGIVREVFWDDNNLAWYTKTIHTKESYEYLLYRLNQVRNEVIGNIYENLELLNADKTR